MQIFNIVKYAYLIKNIDSSVNVAQIFKCYISKYKLALSEYNVTYFEYNSFYERLSTKIKQNEKYVARLKILNSLYFWI
jgi:hypothetical protein